MHALLKYTPTHTQLMPLPAELDKLKLPYAQISDVVYALNSDHPYFQAEALFFVTDPTPFLSYDALGALFPEKEKGLDVRRWITPPSEDNDYTVLYFLCAHTPTDCVGFAVIRHDHTPWDTDDTVEISASLMMIYVRPAFRGNGNSSVMAAASGMALAKHHLRQSVLHGEDIERIETRVYGQGVTLGGRVALERFYDGLAYYLSGEIQRKDPSGYTLPSCFGQISISDDYDSGPDD